MPLKRKYPEPERPTRFGEEKLPALPKKRPRGRRLTGPEKFAAQEVYLKALAASANSREACALAGINPSTLRYWREHDEPFIKRFEEANEQANWLLFSECWRRAVEGEREYVISMGKLVNGPDGEPLTIQKKSDRLLELLLKARMTEFRDRGPTVVNILPKEYINLPDDGVNKP